MPEAGQLTLETFAGRIGEHFRIHASDELTLDATLLEASAAGSVASPQSRAPFSLIFGGPAQPIVPQRIYRLEHDELGAMELFLVPLTPSADGARYQAVFN
jgi:hypothetical protein